MDRHRYLATAIATAVAIGACAADARAQNRTYSGHGAESVPPEVLAKYAPPPLPPELTRRVQAMLDVRGAALGIVGPKGDRLYFGWNITGTPQIWRLDGPKSFPIQMTGGEDATRLSDVTPDGKYLVVSRDVGGQEDPGLYLQPIEGGALTRIHHEKGTRAFYAFTTADSRTLYFAANDIKPDSYAIYRYDIASGERSLVFDTPGLWFVADHREGANGEMQLLLAKATGALSREYFELDVQTRKLTPLLGQGEQIEYDVAYAPAAGEFFVRTNKMGEFRRLYKWTPGGDFSPITPEIKADVEGFVLDRPRVRLYYAVNDGGYTRLNVLDAKSLTPLDLPVPDNPDHVVAGAVSPDGRFVTVGVETSQAPRSSYVYDWATKTLTQWVVPSAPEIDLSRFSVTKLDSYTARDGTSIPMFIRYPAGCAPEDAPAKPCPVVVEFHGGPEGQATPGFSTYAQMFVDSGFIFAQPNVRGSDGYGRTWLSADDGAKRLDIITDIEDAGRELRKRYTRNGQAPKIAIVGGSYGGYSALIGMTMFAGTYDAGVSLVGISNLRTFLLNTAPYRRALRISEYGDPEKDKEALEKLSPTTYIERVKGPLLMIQGVDDPRVPAGESIQMQEALQARGVPSSLILIAGEGHGAARRGGQVLMMGHMIRFLEEHLLGKSAGATN